MSFSINSVTPCVAQVRYRGDQVQCLFICHFLLLYSCIWIESSFESSVFSKKQLDIMIKGTGLWVGIAPQLPFSHDSGGQPCPLSLSCSICQVLILLPAGKTNYWKQVVLQSPFGQQMFHGAPTLCQALSQQLRSIQTLQTTVQPAVPMTNGFQNKHALRSLHGPL